MSDLLVDDTGKVWSTFSSRLLKRIGVSQDRGNFVGCAVRKLGFVHLLPSDGALTVSMRPGFVGRLAIIGALDLIARSRPPRIRVRSVPRSRPPEDFTSIDEALVYIEQLSGSRIGQGMQPLYNAVSHPLEDLGKFARGRLAPLLRVWQEASGQWRPETFEALRRTDALDRLLLCRGDPGGELVIQHWGKKMDLVDARWRRVSAGRSLKAHPIHKLGNLIAQTYRRSIGRSEPHLADVEVVVERPDEKILHRRYDRLILPWRDAEQQPVVSSVCFTRWTERLD